MCRVRIYYPPVLTVLNVMQRLYVNHIIYFYLYKTEVGVDSLGLEDICGISITRQLANPD